MIYIRKIYSSVYTGESEHGHSADDMITVLNPDPLSLDATIEEPARLESGNWRVSCTSSCEASILRDIQYTGATEAAIPLTGDELAEAANEAARANHEVAAMSRAMYRLVTQGASAGE